MNVISHRIPSSKRWIVIIAGLAWSLFARICYASPLPAMLGQTGLGTVISDTNSSGSDYDDYHYTNQTDSQIQPRHIQLDSRGKGLKKSLIRVALWLNPDWALLGFAYVTPEEGEVVGDGNGVQLGSLKLPTMQLDSTKTPGFIYLQPKLGMPAQNPDNRYWTVSGR
ncbi:hypothetical protein C8J55DRAFT_226115 [Lentinula edodes]|uniref:Uncharacterized protein n=1 Tax=Lentinula lateritia TaxID=40482 RepID=A0A9W9DG03_9AGAR|nr:hypothetical protein C8J55DRAFT_226115 [Lentinula edodes]